MTFSNKNIHLQTIELNHFKAPGTSMFGNSSLKEWQRLYTPDQEGLCKWALRSLFIKYGEYSLLIDAGFGNIREADLKEYHVENFINVGKRLDILGIKNITHLLLTHLHLDHCGGLLHSEKSLKIENLFNSSQILLSNKQLNSAENPSSFEADSFQPEIVEAISRSANLKLIEKECFVFPWLELFLFNGHTRGLIVPVIHSPKCSIAFVGDLIPSVAHLILQSTMTYDVNQVLALAEREEFLEEAFENEYILFFQHDIFNECCSLKKEGNKIVPDSIFKLEEVGF